MIPHAVGSYDPLLVTASLLVALAGSVATVAVAGRARGIRSSPNLWTIAAALTFAAGAWATHFAGLLAFRMPVHPGFDPLLTVASIAAALGFSLAGFSLSVRHLAGRWTIPLAGLVTGSGLSAMYFLGAASLEFPATISFGPGLVALSVTCALLAATLAHLLSSRPFAPRLKLAGILLLAFAVAGLHYTGMAATEITVSDASAAVSRPGLRQPAVLLPAALGAVGLIAWGVLSLVLERLRRNRFTASQEARLSAILETAVDSIVVIDDGGTIISINPAAEETFGYGAAELVGQNVRILMPDPHRAGHDGYLADYLRTGERRVIGIGRRAEGRRRDGATFPVGLSVAEWHADGRRFYTGIIRDETERVRAEEALKDSERRQSIAIQASGGGVFEHAIPAGKELHLSPRWYEILGLKELPVAPEAYEQWFGDLIHNEDREQYERGRAAFVAGTVPRHEVELRLRTASGDWIWVRKYAQPVAHTADGKVARISGLIVDITERKKTERWIRQLAHHDPLTGLANRTLFTQELGAAIREADASGRKIALVVIDLDGFKVINDTLGHTIGDGLLETVTERLVRSPRRGDTAARLGGDEFAVILADLRPTDDIGELSRRICRNLVQPAVVEGHFIEFAASFGVAIYPEDGANQDLLMRHADLALHKSKENPSEHMSFFHPELAAAAARRAETETALRQAVRRGELLLHYQPQFDLATGRVRTVEALVRWCRGDRVIFPGEFIAIAEASGVIRPLGAWVLAAACRQQALWRRQGYEFGIAVNVSPAEANTFEITETVDDALTKAGIPGDTLELEITEGLLMDPDAPPVRAFLASCKARGIGLAIDDFGKGYSSLGYLARLPISKVKIDRSFVTRIGHRDEEALIEAIVDLGHRLGHRVVAEGVETRDQLDYLRDLGCDDAQGYFLCRPMPAEALAPVLKAGWQL